MLAREVRVGQTELTMPQLQLPVFPAGAKCITDGIAVECRDQRVVYVYGSLPVFQHDEGDRFAPEGKRKRGDRIPCCRRLIRSAPDHDAASFEVVAADLVRQLRGPHFSTRP